MKKPKREPLFRTGARWRGVLVTIPVVSITLLLTSLLTPALSDRFVIFFWSLPLIGIVPATFLLMVSGLRIQSTLVFFLVAPIPSLLLGGFYLYAIDVILFGAHVRMSLLVDYASSSLFWMESFVFFSGLMCGYLGYRYL